MAVGPVPALELSRDGGGGAVGRARAVIFLDEPPAHELSSRPVLPRPWRYRTSRRPARDSRPARSRRLAGSRRRGTPARCASVRAVMVTVRTRRRPDIARSGHAARRGPARQAPGTKMKPPIRRSAPGAPRRLILVQDSSVHGSWQRSQARLASRFRACGRARAAGGRGRGRPGARTSPSHDVVGRGRPTARPRRRLARRRRRPRRWAAMPARTRPSTRRLNRPRDARGVRPSGATPHEPWRRDGR
jgi:hypothetical protein